ncbi:MAG TPA: hypothetical protein VFW75_15475 [Acetobacteraceae bacterium]|nr:hypothetical protein [Acetobacteraceae bacterium]
MREMSREELLALTPDRYLSMGFLDRSGQPRPELLTETATAAATQLRAAELAPQEFAYTLEALRQLLPLQDGTPRERITTALEEALATVGRMIRQPNNEGLVKWARDCAAQVTRTEDVDALLAHMQAVLRQYSVLATLPLPASSPSAQA